MKTIAIAGAGAMGGRIGTQIQEAGYDVTLLDYWKEHVEKINRDGIEIQTETDTYHLDIKAKFPEEVNEQYDLIIILTKAMKSKEMIEVLNQRGAIKSDTAILTMMNGLGHDETFATVVPKYQIFLAVTMWTAGMRGPGQLLLEGDGTIELQRVDGVADERTETINQIFNDAKLNSRVSDNVFQSVWSKATLNSVLNPLCTILDKRIGEFAQYEQSREMITPIIEEIVAVAEAKGIELNFDDLVKKVEGSYPDELQGLHYPSMHQDLHSGRYTEIDYLNGKIAQYGKEVGVATPTNALLTHMIHQLEMKYVEA
ncbi:2-dehydropantoate 2-reductase [Staphylococcus pettenkoferi]|uniref:2-dehydropantoate 2-reductase n=1 Tax=Staphylococcus pettenkoferi TaxID=170573 RepID=A0ABT4BHA9_9STAP|nr:2-dehydropantoate 2-reductase [Staphylococcus pettenkoferi]MCY1563490.1 2-dehydropantoate 2-reductase [Staphylococcus pettenkoferi]MCY1570518.1 2-dehydropantoate 2-reductase [Staphylococcus pettenkoferi]MCY1582056.1 2-dehydropantoate 2-reductase [Staphylococcus pettenkoferi]MCY1606222.1 2-dehydropantoate 2-reductase [Staphylococcus pettenkoferi]MDH9615962.1 2-dehydropantoate 2-reductase [Staphylococcus pettenkoferi]